MSDKPSEQEQYQRQLDTEALNRATQALTKVDMHLGQCQQRYEAENKLWGDMRQSLRNVHTRIDQIIEKIDAANSVRSSTALKLALATVGLLVTACGTMIWYIITGRA